MSNINIKAMGPRVLVRETQLQSREINGLHIVLREPDKLQHGTVLSVGQHPHNDELGVSVGDTVWYRRECGSPVSDDLVFLLSEHLDAVGDAEVMALVRSPG